MRWREGNKGRRQNEKEMVRVEVGGRGNGGKERGGRGDEQ